MEQSKENTWFVIINPAAGQGTFKSHLKQSLRLLESQGISMNVVYTEYPKHAIELVRLGVEQGFRKIIAFGGDGTNNEVVNGIMQQELVDSKELTYCLLPVGTGNDWIKEYQIPKNLNAWVKMLKAGNHTLQDVGLVHYHQAGEAQQRYFTNVAGMAYDPFVLAEMAKLRRPVTNRLAYLLYGMYYVFKYKLPKARVQFNGKVVEDKFYLINAGICRYSGGGMQLVPHAVPHDGRLALTLAGALSKLGVIFNSYRFYNGTIGGHKKVDTFQAETIRVEAMEEPILVEVDGEVIGETPVVFSLVPGALRVLVP